jgi:protein-tyrosine phosphatase
MAAVMLAQRLDALGVDANVSSAGLLATGVPATALGIEVMAARQLDLTGHRSRRLEPTLVTGADLVLAMERAQLREVVLLAPAVRDRCFTLKELARRSDLVGPRFGDEPLRDWLARVSAGRAKSMLLGHDPADDIADPYGGARTDFERTASELEMLVDHVTRLAWGTAQRN